MKYLANQHQIKYKAKLLKKDISGNCILSDTEAQKGINFYLDFPGLVETVNDRYKFFDNKIIYKNMLKEVMIKLLNYLKERYLF